MGVKYLWDTNIAIYFLQQQLPPSAEKYIDTLLAESPPCIASITEIELLCWKNATEKDLQVIYQFIHDALVIELDQSIKHRTVSIRKQYNIKLPDAIIAATALTSDLTLVTRNVKDFNQIHGLQIIDPWVK
jgi:predicted nucleic acid-binding protein